VIRQSECHGRRDTQGFADAAEIVVGDVECDGGGVISARLLKQLVSRVKRRESLDVAGPTISVVPNDQLETQQTWTAKDALKYTVGVDSDTRGNFVVYDIFYSRGFRSRDTEMQRVRVGPFAPIVPTIAAHP